MATINGNKNANLLVGTGAADHIRGRGGDDTLIGADGNDTLNGGRGNDRIEVGPGDDMVIGGQGTDTVVFSGNRDDYTIVDLGGGDVRVIGPDGDNTIESTEFFEFADMTQSYSEVLLSRVPNLTATSLSVDDTSLAPGEGSSVTFDMISNGTGNAGETTYELLVANAPDEGSVISVLDSQTAGALVIGGTASLTAMVPADSLAPGTYWVAVRVDAGDVLAETDETDNLTEWVQIVVEEPVTDLTLSTSVAASSDTDLGLGGGSIAIDYTIENVGNTGSGGYRLVAVLSRDGTISADDIQLGEVTGQIGLGENLSGQLVGALAEETGDGDWQVLTALEWTGGEVDATPADNATAETVNLIAAYGDLQLNVTTLGPNTDLDLNGGGQIQMTYDWANTGTTTPSYFTLRSYLSTDMEISADDMPILGITGGTYTGQVASSTTTHYFQPEFEAGDYYIISVIAWGDGTEDPTDDNTIIQQITFTPPTTDLAIDSVTIDPASDLFIDGDGIRILADVNVSNLGGISATATVTAWLSTDTSITGDDIQINPGSITLGIGGTGTVSIDQTITDALEAGDYTLIVALTTPDDNASNSIFYAPVTLDAEVTPPPITGTAGDDLLIGTAEGEEINALEGNDTVVASDGFDVVDGGSGFDTIDFSGETEGVRILSDFSNPTMLNREDMQTFGLEQTYANFESVIGSAYDDMVGTFSTSDSFHFDLGDGSDVALGADGDDILNMGAGNDSVSGGMGDDTITLGSGADMMGLTRWSEGQFPFGDGNDIVTDFDTTEDIIIFQIVNGTTYDALTDATQTAEGTLISYVEGSSVLLEGVNLSGLTADNFLYDDTIYVAT